MGSTEVGETQFLHESGNIAPMSVRSAFTTAVQLMDAGRASLLVRDGRGQVLEAAAAVGVDPAILRDLRVPLGRGVAGTVAARGVSLFGTDGRQAFISTPVQTARGIEGVLNFTARRQGDYSPKDVGTARSVAHLIGEILEFGRYASYDAGSGLLNRRAFDQMLQRELARFRRTGSPFAVAFVDLDNLKAINDAYGHARGDDVIRAVADALQRTLRPYDVASRYGGDEFALLIPLADGAGSALSERLAEAISTVPRLIPEPITVSIGVARCPEDGKTAAELLGAADARMYEQKAGKPHRAGQGLTSSGRGRNPNSPPAGPSVARTETNP